MTSYREKAKLIDLPLLIIIILTFFVSLIYPTALYFSLLILVVLLTYQAVDIISSKRKKPVTVPSTKTISHTFSKRTVTVKLPALTNWDPNVWIGREIYGYKVISIIGSGGNGYVLKAKRGGAEYAIKIFSLNPNLKSTVTIQAKSSFDELFKESDNLKKLSQYPAFVTIYGIYIDSNIIKSILQGDVDSYFKYPPAIVMEYMEGGSVDSLMKIPDVVNSPYWPLIVKEIIKEVAQALEYLHSQGYVHLDVKPQNIFLKQYLGNTGEKVYNNLAGNVKLGDLGSAVKIGGKIEDITPAYSPPDQVEAVINGSWADPKMDIFALGMTALTLLNLKVNNPAMVYLELSVDALISGDVNQALYNVYRAKQALVSWKPNIPYGTPKELERVIIKSLSISPSDRPTASEIVRMLSI